MMRILIFLLLLLSTDLAAQPPLDQVLFSNVNRSELIARDSEWKKVPNHTEDQYIAWFLVRYHMLNVPGLQFSKQESQSLRELISQIEKAYPGGFATVLCNAMTDRNPWVVSALPVPQTDFQSRLLELENLKSDVLGHENSNVIHGKVLGMLTPERKAFYNNLHKCLPAKGIVLCGGYEDALALWAVNNAASKGKFIEIIPAEALLYEPYRVKKGQQCFGHPAGTPGPEAFVASLVKNRTHSTVIVNSMTFSLFDQLLNDLFVRGLCLTGLDEPGINGLLWKGFDKTHVIKGKAMAENYLPMLEVMYAESASAEVKVLIRKLQ